MSSKYPTKVREKSWENIGQIGKNGFGKCGFLLTHVCVTKEGYLHMSYDLQATYLNYNDNYGTTKYMQYAYLLSSTYILIVFSVF